MSSVLSVVNKKICSYMNITNEQIKCSMNGNRGFTLLELILVMVIISTLLAVASPSLQGFFSSRRTDDAASNMLSLIKLARSLSISEGRIYRFNIDSDESLYWLTAAEKGVYEKLNTEFGRSFLLPDDTTVTLDKQTDGKSIEQYIEFYPEGKAEPGTIKLTDMRGNTVEILSASPFEQYHIKNPEEDTGNE